MQQANTIKELIQIARDGETFYRDAIDKVDDSRLKTFFSDMAGHKRQIIEPLAAKLRVNDEDVPESGTVAGKFRQAYTDLRSSMSSNEAKLYVSQLEETEDRLLHHFTDALESVEDPSTKTLLQSLMPQVRSCHDQMRDLKKQYTH